MNEILQQLLTMGPAIGAGLSGNGQQMQAFMDGYQRTMQQLQARKQQDRLMGQSDEDRRLAMEDRTRGIERQTAADARARTVQSQQDALSQLQIPGALAEAASGAETPADAKALIESLIPKMQAAFGQEAMAFGMPAVEQATKVITGRQKKQVESFVDAALKVDHVINNPDADPEITQLPEHIQKIVGKPTARLSELQTFAQLPVGKPPKKERPPAMAGSFEDYVQRKYGDAPTPEQILEARKVYQQVDDRPRITVNTGNGGHPPAVQRRVDAVVKGFDSQPIVKKIAIMSEAVAFADALDPNTNNSADDQALIYNFAKMMDPESVVRESEYQTIQRYSQSLASTYGFDAKRVLSNTPFLTPQSRKQLKDTIRARFNASKGQYENLRNEFGRRIERITGKTGGVDELTDYGAAFPAASTPSPAKVETSKDSKVSTNATGPQLKERRTINGQLAEWDGTGWLPVK